MLLISVLMLHRYNWLLVHVLLLLFKLGKPFKDDPKEIPTPPNHVCGPQQNHILCQCCLQPFPDYRVGGMLPQGAAPLSCK